MTGIKGAVEGRETEILDKLGIRWRDGQPPYPLPLSRTPRQARVVALGCR